MDDPPHEFEEPVVSPCAMPDGNHETSVQQADRSDGGRDDLKGVEPKAELAKAYKRGVRPVTLVRISRWNSISSRRSRSRRRGKSRFMSRVKIDISRVPQNALYGLDVF
jgi:hypothetical protein